MNEYQEAAWLGNFGSLFPSKTTWLEKKLVDVDLLSETPNESQLSNYYIKVMDNNVAYGSGKTMSGEWIENQAFIHWLSSAIQKNVFSLLLTKNKIPATTQGAELVIAKLREVLELGIIQDGISSYDIYDYTLQPNQHNIKIKFKAMLVNSITYVDGIDGEITT